jgi:arylsulfatase A-like enzyme
VGHRVLRSVIIACIGAITAASIDGAVGYVSSGSRFAPVPFALLAFSLTAFLAFLLILTVRWLLVAPLFRHHGNDDALTIATAMGVVAMFILYDGGSHVTRIERLFSWTLDLVLAASVAVGWYSLITRDAENIRWTPVRIAGRALAFVMLLAVVATWVIFEQVKDLTSLWGVISLLAFGLAGWMAVRLAMSVTATRWSEAVLGLFAVIMIAGIVGLIALRGSRSLATTPAQARATGKIHQVILLTVDTLRRDSLSCYGSHTVKTPHIDSIANDGTLFRNLISTSSWTVPAFASIMTALPTYGHGLLNATTILPDTVVTLAERFQQAGYTTFGVVANGLLARHRGFAQGFDGFEVREVRLPPVCIGDRLTSRIDRHLVEDETSTRDVTDVAIMWSQQHRDQDFFLWVHYMDPHLPYRPPRPYIERSREHEVLGYTLDISSMVRPTTDLFGTPAERAWVRSLYDGEVRYVDAEIGRLLKSLKNSGIYDRALIVFGVDHGEEFWDHDGFEHGHTLYQELVNVPFIIKQPRSQRAATADDPVSGCDIAPTILDLCGLPALNSPTSKSLAARVVFGEPVPDHPLYSGATLFRSNWESVTFGGWKYIRSKTTNDELLFDLVTDPGEHQSLVLERPQVAARARALLDEHERAMEVFRQDAGISNPSVKMDKEELARLRTLGYL